jgi:hypothetical protein
MDSWEVSEGVCDGEFEGEDGVAAGGAVWCLGCGEKGTLRSP